MHRSVIVGNNRDVGMVLCASHHELLGLFSRTGGGPGGDEREEVFAGEDCARTEHIEDRGGGAGMVAVVDRP